MESAKDRIDQWKSNQPTWSWLILDKKQKHYKGTKMFSSVNGSGTAEHPHKNKMNHDRN